jgi:hypothetical protein
MFSLFFMCKLFLLDKNRDARNQLRVDAKASQGAVAITRVRDDWTVSECDDGE